MTPSQYTIKSVLKSQEEKIKSRAKFCDDKMIPLVRDTTIQAEKNKMLGMLEVAKAIELDTTEFRYIYLL